MKMRIANSDGDFTADVDPEFGSVRMAGGKGTVWGLRYALEKFREELRQLMEQVNG